MDRKIMVISGGSSGIGLATALFFSERGFKVYDLSRHGGAPEEISHIPCDVSSEEQVQAAINQVLTEVGRINVCVVNAGFGIAGSLEGTKDRDAKRQLEINLHGALRLAKAALPALRETKGRLIAVSSVAGNIAIPYQSWYSASKAALQSAFLALDNEARDTGVRALTVLPGDTATSFTDNRVHNQSDPNCYGSKVRSSVGKMEADERQGKPPITVAKVIWSLAHRKNPPPQTVVGFSYKFLILLFKLFPLRLTNWIVGKLYS
ncbi:MAG TPA: SDR family NAD(P)-dependent oxidoreductase [Clostridiaceae bacterium]|nr:SDR family NAD(P)-dependent oxidoreductase [Clostridiaceae bacterium]